MVGKQERWQEDLGGGGPFSSLVPDDHILKQIGPGLVNGGTVHRHATLIRADVATGVPNKNI